MQEYFNQYYLIEQLASKPLRSVYLAHRAKDASQKVVIKLFDAACLNPEQEKPGLFHKVEWTKQIKHGHIVPILDLGIEQGQPYVVSKYLASGSLRQRLSRLSPQRLELQEVLRIIFQVGDALCYAHKQNILHSNIKPENIFFNKQGKVLLADFRLVNFINVTKLNYKSDPHTTCYMAPEQFSGTISEKSDQYGLACLAYELITGRAPFSAQGFFSMWAKQSTQQAVPLGELVPNLPEPIERIVLKAMAKDPSERYANVSTFLNDLETTSLSLTTATSTKTAIAPASKTLLARGTEPLKALRADSALVTRLSKTSPATPVLDRPEHGISKTFKLSTEPLEASDSDTDLVTYLSKTVRTSRILDRPRHAKHDISKTLEPSTEPLDAIGSNPARVTRLSKTSPASHALERPRVANHSSTKTLGPSTEPLDAIGSNPARVTRLSKTSPASRVLDHSEHTNHGSSKTPGPSTEPLDAIGSNPARVTHLSKVSPASRVLDHSEHTNHSPSKTLNTQPNKPMETASRETHAESLPIARFSPPKKSVTPTLWLAFALSSVLLLMGTVILYSIVPLRSPASSKAIKSKLAITIPTHQIVDITPTAQPTVQNQQVMLPTQQKKQTMVHKPLAAPRPTTPLVQTSLTGSYAQQNQAYNLTNEGKLDWIDWGLNTPQDVNHKANAQQQISNFAVVGNSTVQRDSYYSNSNIEWFDGIPQPDTASSQTWGVYVTGINNGFSITVPASTTPRTLRVYVGAKLAQGQFTASLAGKTYTDATLDMAHDPTTTQANGIYTVVFNGNTANQALTVTYKAMASNGSNSYVMLQAATLQ